MNRYEYSKAALALALVITLGTLAVPADARTGKQPSPEQIVQRMTQRLGLSDAQREAVLPILMDARRDNEAVREKYELDKLLETLRKAREEQREVENETRKKLGGVLTANQMDEYDRMLSKLRGRMRDRMQNRLGADAD